MQLYEFSNDLFFVSPLPRLFAKFSVPVKGSLVPQKQRMHVYIDLGRHDNVQTIVENGSTLGGGGKRRSLLYGFLSGSAFQTKGTLST